MSGTLKAAKRGGRKVGLGGHVEGDPGLFGSLFDAARGAFRGAVSGFVGTPAPLPVPISVAVGGGGRTGRGIALPALPGRPRGPTAGPTQRLGLTLPASTMGRPAGFHLNKTAYFLMDGTHVPAGSRWVKNRRRNPLNPRALRRAIGRIDAGKVWQGKLREISTAKFTSAGNRK